MDAVERKLFLIRSERAEKLKDNKRIASPLARVHASIKPEIIF
jgi:hypothetical protein